MPGAETTTFVGGQRTAGGAGSPAVAGAHRHAADTDEHEPGSWRASWRIAAAVWLTLHAAYLIVTGVHRALGPATPGSALDNWLQWDGWNYRTIAEQGYGVLPQQTSFFPVFPLLARALGMVLPGGIPLMLLLISN